MALVNQYALATMNAPPTKYVSIKFVNKDVDRIKVVLFT